MSTKIVDLARLSFEDDKNFIQITPLVMEKLISNKNIVEGKELIKFIKKTIKDKNIGADKKYYSLVLLNNCIMLENVALLIFITKKIFKRLQILAKYKKDIKDMSRGGTIFGARETNKNKASLFLSTLLCYIRDWSENFGKDSNGNSTEFLRLYSNLVKDGVLFPENNFLQNYGPHITINEPGQDLDNKKSTIKNTEKKRPEPAKNKVDTEVHSKEIRDLCSLIADMHRYENPDKDILNEIKFNLGEAKTKNEKMVEAIIGMEGIENSEKIMTELFELNDLITNALHQKKPNDEQNEDRFAQINEYNIQISNNEEKNQELAPKMDNHDMLTSQKFKFNEVNTFQEENFPEEIIEIHSPRNYIDIVKLIPKASFNSEVNFN